MNRIQNRAQSTGDLVDAAALSLARLLGRLNERVPKDFEWSLTADMQEVFISFTWTGNLAYQDDVRGASLEDVVQAFEAIDWGARRRVAVARSRP